MSDSLPLENSSSMIDKKKKAKIKRRYSLDSSALRKLSSISRSFSFGRKSNRCLKQGSESKSVDKSHNKHDEKTDNHDLGPCHSSPYNRLEQVEMDKHKNYKVNQDKETSFDVYNLDRTFRNENCLERPRAIQDSLKYTVEGRVNTLGNENSYLVSKIFTGGNPTVGSRSKLICSDSCNDFASHSSEIRGDDQRLHNAKHLQEDNHCSDHSKEFCAKAKVNSKSPTTNSRVLWSISADTRGCVQAFGCSDNAQGQSGCSGQQFSSKTYDKNCKTSAQSTTVGSLSCNCKANGKVFNSSVPCVHQGYDQSIVKNTSRESGRYSPVEVRSIQGGSPTILKRELSQHHSPTLINDIDTSFYLYPLHTDPISDHEVKPNAEVKIEGKKVRQKIKEMKSKPREAERENFVMEKDENSLGPNLSSDFYTDDNVFLHDRHLGIIDPEKQRSYLIAEHQSSEVSKSLPSTLRGRYKKKNSTREDANVNGNDQLVASKEAEDGRKKSVLRLASSKSSRNQHFENHTPKATDLQNPKTIYDIPVIEDSGKGIKVTVSRAKKKLKDFTSPRVSRKKRQNIRAFSRETDSQARKVEDSCPVNAFSYDDLNCDKSLRYHDRKQESFSSVDLSFDQSLISSIVVSPQIENDGKCHEEWCKHGKLETSKDEGDLSFKLTARRSISLISSSANNDLSISSDFHSTVTKMLRSNSVNSNSPVRVGSSTFYCKAEKDHLRMLLGSANESGDFSWSRSADSDERKDSVCSGGSNSTELLNSNSNVKDEICKESVIADRRENGYSPKQKRDPIR